MILGHWGPVLTLFSNQGNVICSSQFIWDHWFNAVMCESESRFKVFELDSDSNLKNPDSDSRKKVVDSSPDSNPDSDSRKKVVD